MHVGMFEFSINLMRNGIMSNELNKSQTPETQASTDSSKTVVDEFESKQLLDEPARRMFFKRVALGGGGALMAGAGTYGLGMNSLQGSPSDDYPLIDEKIFKPKDQRDTVLNFVSSKALNEKHPERNVQYNQLQHKEFNWQNGIRDMYSKPWDNSKPGYTQLDRALQKAGWEPLVVAGSRTSANLQPNTPLHAWDQSDVEKEQYKFESE